MSTLIDLRTLLLDRIRTLCASCAVDDVALLAGAITPTDLADLEEGSSAARLVMTGVRETPALYPVGGNFQTRWVLYLFSSKKAENEAALISLLETLLGGLEVVLPEERPRPVVVDTMVARNLCSSSINPERHLLWALSFTIMAKLGTEPFPGLEDDNEL